ncbi:hypothetical protein TanjilG_12860 [Lupinus angustifolius]|uniref:DUF7870 domain-containing protein n=1 Tax=Lupinus angustifolius TaxID=3871 RepID=A0A1J7H7V1_LUPAN|nr:hypothetical protein TanjilG_12860 [Lupinus angustifolius]
MWKICYRLLILILVLASFPLISSSFISRTSPLNSSPQKVEPNSFDSINIDQLLSLFFRDLTSEGIMKKTQEQKVVFLSNENDNKKGQEFKVVNDYNMVHILLNDLEKQNSLLDNTVDFIFTTNFLAASKFIDRTLKTGGVATVILNDNPSAAFYKPTNYKVLYMRRFDLIALAMKKTGPQVTSIVADEITNISAQRKLLGYATEAKKAALQNLEDVLLEPPRSASGKSRKYLKRTKYLPDLMGDSLESYPRRVFIDVGLPEKDGGSGTDWFPKNYPTRNKNFEIYKIETVTESSSGKDVPQIEMSDWLRRNVKEEEYVVMKSEVEVVEEMMKSKAIMLVDELFLECKPRSSAKHNNGDNVNDGNNGRSRRAYWECLALYGKLRDEGVAVHQWESNVDKRMPYDEVSSWELERSRV